MKKRGYYFITDALISAVILAIGFLLVSSFYTAQPEKIRIEHVAGTIMDFLSETKLNDLCSETGKCTDPSLEEAYNYIMNKNNTLLEAIGELYVLEHKDSAAKIIKSIVLDNNMVPKGFNITLNIESSPESKVVVYPSEDIPSSIIRKSKVLVSSKKIVFGYIKRAKEPIAYWGPYTAEVQVMRIPQYIKCSTDSDCPGSKCHPIDKVCTGKIVQEGDVCFTACDDPDFYCRNFQCVKKSTELGKFCINQLGCGAGYYCYKLRCVSTKGDAGYPCGYNDDCNTGLICDNGYCSVVQSKEGGSCSAGKCGIGFYCENGICVSTTGSIKSKCDSNTDCLSGNICNLETGECEEGNYNPDDLCESEEECGPGVYCKDGKCEPTSGEIGSPCGNDIDCGILLICDDETKTCQQGDANPGEECSKEEDCADELTCDLTLEPPICVSDTCAEQSDCGDGLICDMSLDPPKCIVTTNGAGAACYTDSDCDTGFYCDDFKCINGMNQAGDSCEIEEDCGAGLICKDNICAIANGNPCDACNSLTDCNKPFPQGNTICIDGICNLPDNENGDCPQGCYCGSGLFCAIADNKCHETDGTLGSFCNDDTDCDGGSKLKCISGICSLEEGFCGDGILDESKEECEPGSTKTCAEVNCQGAGIVSCNGADSADECKWNKVACNCNICDFPGDCNKNCEMTVAETQTLLNQWILDQGYLCGEINLLPTIGMPPCSYNLYILSSYADWRSVNKCQGIS